MAGKKRYADDFADTKKDDGVATRSGGTGSKFPTKNRNTVKTNISATVRATATRSRRSSKVQTEAISDDFADLYAMDVEGDETGDETPEERDDPQEPVTAQFSWGDVEERDDEDEDDAPAGEETRRIVSIVANAEEQQSRNQYKGVVIGDTGPNGKIVWVPIAQLVPADYNPRSITPQEMANLKQSLEEFGMPEPVVVNTYPGRENIIVGGHQRVEAARQLGWEMVPVTYIYLNFARERQLNLALNRISGTWDERLLAQLITDLQDDGADLMLTGFDEGELSELLAAGAGIDDQIDLGADFDSDKDRGLDGTVQIVVITPKADYDDEISEVIRAAVDSIRARYPKIAVQTKGA